MGNPQKGEIDFEIGGKVWTYVLGTYALRVLERRRGKPWPLILQEAVNNWSVDLCLDCWQAGLLMYHEPITEKEASRLLDEITVERFTREFVAAISLQFPDQEQEGGDGAARPPVAASPSASGSNGIGIESSSNG